MNRIFIVGCPRSGTTLLQTILLSNDSLISFPESHFFSQLNNCPRRKPPGIYGKKIVDNWLGDTKVKFIKKPWIGFSKAAAINYFWQTLDQIAITQSAKGWVEKTPEHVHYIGEIQRSIPDAKFIHIVRSYKDNIASLYLARKKWNDESKVVTSARNWFGHISKSLYYLNQENHFHISYDELVRNPNTVVKQLSGFLGVEFTDIENVNLAKYAQQVVENDATWKSNNLQSQSIDRNKKSNYSTVFSSEEQDEIETYINSINKWLGIVDIHKS